MGRTRTPTCLTIVALLFMLAAAACVCVTILPKLPWYRFQVLSFETINETRHYVHTHFSENSKYREFWEVILLLNISSVACLGLAFFVLLFVLFLGRRGFQKACSTASFTLILIFSLLGFAAAAVTTIYYAAEHQNSVAMCHVAATADLPFCRSFWARDDLGNEGYPLYGWYLSGAASIFSLISIIFAVCARPHRYLNYRRLN